jgi:hypothetical protein
MKREGVGYKLVDLAYDFSMLCNNMLIGLKRKAKLSAI